MLSDDKHLSITLIKSEGHTFHVPSFVLEALLATTTLMCGNMYMHSRKLLHELTEKVVQRPVHHDVGAGLLSDAKGVVVVFVMWFVLLELLNTLFIINKTRGFYSRTTMD